MKALIRKSIAVFVLGLFCVVGGNCTTETDVIDPTLKDYWTILGQLNLVNALGGVCGVGNTSLEITAQSPKLEISTVEQSVTYAADTSGNYWATIQLGQLVAAVTNSDGTTTAANTVVITGTNLADGTHYPVLSTDTSCPYAPQTTGTGGATAAYSGTTSVTLTTTATGLYSLLMYCPNCGSAPSGVTIVRN